MKSESKTKLPPSEKPPHWLHRTTVALPDGVAAVPQFDPGAAVSLTSRIALTVRGSLLTSHTSETPPRCSVGLQSSGVCAPGAYAALEPHPAVG